MTQLSRSLNYQNLSEKYFHGFILWSTRLNVQVKIKILVFRLGLLKNAFIIYETPTKPWHDLIISPI